MVRTRTRDEETRYQDARETHAALAREEGRLTRDEFAAKQAALRTILTLGALRSWGT